MFGGRGWPAPGEPYFTPDDGELALAWQADHDNRCPQGHPLDLAVTGDRVEAQRWQAEELQCTACAVETWRREALHEGGGDLAGVYVYAAYNRDQQE